MSWAICTDIDSGRRKLCVELPVDLTGLRTADDEPDWAAFVDQLGGPRLRVQSDNAERGRRAAGDLWVKDLAALQMVAGLAAQVSDRETAERLVRDAVESARAILHDYLPNAELVVPNSRPARPLYAPKPVSASG